MSTRTSIGWQTMLADLCLILFMVSAAAMAEKPDGKGGPHPPAPPPRPHASTMLSDPARASPLALWSARPGGISLAQWLATQAPDSRQQLTITADYPPGGGAQALARAQDTMRAGGAMAQRARLIIEPAADEDVTATLAYDRDP